MSMNESFKKFFRNPEDDIKVRNQGSFDEEELAEIRRDLAADIMHRYSEQESKALPLEELGEDIHIKIEFLLEAATDYFKSLGFSDVKFNPFYLFSGDLDEESGISSRSEGVLVHNTKIDDVGVRQLQFLKTLAHELYHSTAAVSLTVKDSFPTPNHHIRDIYFEEGAGYNTDYKNEPRALEEGLATRFEALMFAKIREWYPSESVEYFDDITAAIYEHVDMEKNDLFDITIHRLADGSLDCAASQYRDSRELVHFLAERVPNFDQLVEAGRLERHTLPLARAIEAEFGEGSYRKITTTKDIDARKLIDELSS